MNPLNNRRTLLKGMAVLAAGSMGPVLAHGSMTRNSAATRSPFSNAPAHNKPRTVACSDATTVVETSSGRIRGFKRNGVYIFNGVPYGDSTSGSRRFMPPEPPGPWTGIRNALAYGRVCPQDDSAHFITDGQNLARSDEDAFLLHRGCAISVPGEDCLRVNIWTPEINGHGKRPVMVYMHGGGYSGGSGHDLLSYDGESLARNHDVVVVNHNHRLNVYGYLNLAMIGGEPFSDSANVGMLDIVAALEWVRTHISMFGGDPGNVTVFGQSGGGGKVAALMAMPGAKGLFHRAAIQSGPFLKALSADYSQEVAEALLKELGLAKSQVRELQTIPVDRLSGAATEASRKTMAAHKPAGGSFGETGWGPTVDGRSLPHHPFDRDGLAISANIPLITGTNLNESTNGVDRPGATEMTVDEMVGLVREAYGSESEAIIGAYRADYPDAIPFSLWATIEASRWRIPAFAQATRKAALGAAPAFSYIYSWRTPSLDRRPGSFHAAEISFVFDNAEICDHYSAGDPSALALSKQMSTAWVSFARTGNPNHAGLPNWPAYTPDGRGTMYFDAPCFVRNDAEGRGLSIISPSSRA
ncbi:MAG TPA: carboxylesterase family protein [Terracidiphilus sp.]